MSDATWHGADSPPMGAEHEPEGCELCSFTPGGCSFCSDRSAIEVANERTETAGVPVVDLNDVMDHLTAVAASADQPLCGFDDCAHPHDRHPEVTADRVRYPCTVEGCNCVDYAQPGSVYQPPGAVTIRPGDPEAN